MTTLVNQGWQCPICQRVLAPWLLECPCKGKVEETTKTTQTTTTVLNSHTQTNN